MNVGKPPCPASTGNLWQQIAVTMPVEDVNPPKLRLQPLQLFLRVLSGLVRVDEKALGKRNVMAPSVIVGCPDAEKTPDVNLNTACVWIVVTPPVLREARRERLVCGKANIKQ